MPTTPEKLRLPEKLCFGFGDLASVLYWQTFMLYLTFFYTDVFGITAAAAAGVILFSRLFDGVIDPVIGMLADRTNTRWGKFRPYLLWFCVPIAVVGVLTFTTPNFDAAHKLYWAYGTLFALMFLYTAINIPYTAILGVITPDPIERTSVSSIKFLFAYSSATIVGATLLPLVKTLGHGNPALGWQLAFVVYGIAAVIFFLIAFLGTRERVHPPKEQKTSVGRDLADLITNGPWVILLITTLIFILFVATRSSVTVHYFKYYVGPHTLTLPFAGGPHVYGFESIVSAFNFIGSMSAIAGVLLLTWFTRLVGKKPAFIILFVIAVASTQAFYFLGPDQIGAMFLLQIAGTITGGPLSALLWAMYADTADYGEWKKGRRATGLVFSASTMGQKVGWAVGGFVALQLLSFFGFKANVAQTPEVLHGLVLLMSTIPAAMGVVAILLILIYPLNEAKVTDIGAALNARRAEAS